MAMLLSGLQNRESSIAAQLPVDTDWGDVSGGKRSLYLSVKKARGERACTTRRRRALSHGLFRGSQGCLSHFGRAGQVQCSDQRGLREVLFGGRQTTR